MDQREILSRLDHTILTPDATWEQVRTVCDEGRRLETASVCVPPRYVKRVNGYVGGSLKICTVVGFPNGYTTPEVKVFETEDAIRNGADEIDMVINQGLAKEGDWEGVLSELRAVKASCKGRILKVIVEACRFTQEEKISLCRVVSMAGADFIKTSTGFAQGGSYGGGCAPVPGAHQPRYARQGRRRHPYLRAGTGAAGGRRGPHRRQRPGRSGAGPLSSHPAASTAHTFCPCPSAPAPGAEFFSPIWRKLWYNREQKLSPGGPGGNEVRL